MGGGSGSPAGCLTPTCMRRSIVSLLFPAKAAMVNHNFYSTLAEILSSSPVDSPPYPPLSTEYCPMG